MKRITAILLALLILCGSLAHPASAQSGEPLGWVLHSDIVAYIDGHPIRSYNIDGSTYVAAEDLREFGFSVYGPAERKILRISLTAGEITSDYVPPTTPVRSGSRAGTYEASEYLVVLAGEPASAYSIDGRLCIAMDDLAKYCGADYVWDPDARQLRLTVYEDRLPRIPSWTFTYDTPGYDKDTAMDGEYAVWEFEKNEAGEFVITHSEGDTLFTPQISFGSTEMSYRIDVTDMLVTNAGRTEYYSEPHTLAAHDALAPFLLVNSESGSLKPGMTASDGTELFAEWFRHYAAEMPQYAAEILQEAGDLRNIWKVYYNGEPLTGIGIKEARIVPISKYKRNWEYRFLYDRSYPLEEVQTVRIELRIPDEHRLPAASDTHLTDTYCGFAFGDGTLRFSYPGGRTAILPETVADESNTAVYVTEAVTAAAVFDEEDLLMRVRTSFDRGETWTTAEIDLCEPTPEGAEHRDFWLDIHPYDAWMGYTSATDGWLMLTTYYGMSTGKQLLYKTADGGQSWTRTYESDWRSYAVGAGVSSKYIYLAMVQTDEAVPVLRSADGGVTWEEYDLTSWLFGDNLEYAYQACAPVFNGDRGAWRILRREDPGLWSGEIVLITRDGGETWTVQR